MVSRKVDEDLRISGVPEVSFKASIKGGAIISVMVADLGEDRRLKSEERDETGEIFTFAFTVYFFMKNRHITFPEETQRA